MEACWQCSGMHKSVGEDRQLVQRPLRPHLMEDADAGINHEHAPISASPAARPS